jgi:LemA protein
MNFRRILTIAVIVLLVIMVFGMCGSYNTVVGKDENVKQAWSQVENQYQRRADLIPNLVETVKGYAKHEQGTFQAVVEARAKATQTTVNVENLSPEEIQRFEQAQAGLNSALGRLLAIAENYPDLKANTNFLALQQQLEGTENRITVERKKFNETVQDYNSYVRRFPTNLYTGIFGFRAKGYFQSAPGSDRAPSVQF